jgi:hypothetical protein
MYATWQTHEPAFADALPSLSRTRTCSHRGVTLGFASLGGALGRASLVNPPDPPGYDR